MKPISRPQHYRVRRILQLVREGISSGRLANSSDFMADLGISRRTVARDLDFLRDEERAPLEYDGPSHGFRLTDETFTLPPVTISRKEAFSFGLARKLLAHYEGTPLHLEMRSVMDKISESLEGDITIEPGWLSDHVGVLAEDHVMIDAIISGNQVLVKWGWGGNGAYLDLCEIHVDRGDGKGFGLLTYDSTPNYTDTQPFPATPAKWTYKAIYRVGDSQVGLWSLPVSITVGN